MGTLSKALPSNLTLRERLELKKSTPVLILDCSGSMGSDCEPGIQKITALRDIVKGLIASAVIAFNDNATIITKDTIPNPYGGTVMSSAIALAKSSGYKAGLMITDGEAQDKQQTLEAVKDFNLQILYVGPGPKPKFLDDLAKAGCGECTLEDLSRPKELQEKVQKLLGSGEVKRSIEL